jgi:hypothetical protein
MTKENNQSDVNEIEGIIHKTIENSVIFPGGYWNGIKTLAQAIEAYYNKKMVNPKTCPCENCKRLREQGFIDREAKE